MPAPKELPIVDAEGWSGTEPALKSYQSIDHFNTFRGHVITVKIPRTDLLPEVGEAVLIDDKEYTVSGVEYFWKLMAPPIRGEDVGLVVRS